MAHFFHSFQMWCCLALVVLAAATASGMRRFSYDGTPLAEGVVVVGGSGGVSPSVPVVGGGVQQPVPRVFSGPVPVPASQQSFLPVFASSSSPQTVAAVSPVLPPPAPAVSPVLPPQGPRRCSYPLGSLVSCFTTSVIFTCVPIGYIFST